MEQFGYDGIVGFKFRNRRRVVGRHEVFQYLAAASGQKVFGANIVLDGNGNARQEGNFFPGGDFFVNLGRAH